ncbi:MAG: 1-deoxy-D-xylulose-5-phosphate synthase [Candidatus Moraniibacteriota bacterium]
MIMLEKVNFPKDLKKLTPEELAILAGDIRQFLLEKVSKSGGHLASNLGVVELTIALHKFLDCPMDALVWDVGHQSYVHKILTGRKKLFVTLRKKGGLSGFPDPAESKFDLFKTGHASTSISTAMGIAETNRRLGKKARVVAVIGDGSFTGGLALCAINQIGYLQTKMTIIMNDNRMSIAENVGALSLYTKRIEKTQTYLEVKKNIERLLSRCAASDSASCLGDIKKLKKSFKQVGTPGLLFEKLGVHYIGPIDGHSIEDVQLALKKADNYPGPVLIHVRTTKGSGYQLAENGAEKFHGVSPFDLENGNSQKKSESKSFTDIFGETILAEAKKNPKIIGITAAMPSGTGLNNLANILPEQFFDVGICEEHAVAFAAGMAKNGFSPIVVVYSTFMQRALDQVIHDVALQNLPVIFALDRAGLVGEDGPTHHGVFDLSFLRFIPNLVLMAPRDGEELSSMLRFALKLKKPVVIRYPRGSAESKLEEKFVNLKRMPIFLGKAELIRKGRKKVIISLGNQIEKALTLAKKNSDCAVYNARFIKPLDPELIRAIKNADEATILEENVKAGGFGSAILEELARLNIKTKIKLIGIADEFVEHGEVSILREKYLN